MSVDLDTISFDEKSNNIDDIGMKTFIVDISAKELVMRVERANTCGEEEKKMIKLSIYRRYMNDFI